MGKPIRILLVDGHTVMRDALRALIATAPDMEVVGEATDSTKAMKQVTLLQPDVIVLDLSALGSDGLEVVVSLMSAPSQPRILVLTNEVNEQEIRGAIDAGVKGYLPKGTAAPEILQAIQALYQDESIIDSTITNALI